MGCAILVVVAVLVTLVVASGHAGLTSENAAADVANTAGNKVFSLIFSWILGERVTDTLCGTKVLWANDYPHHEGSWPHSAASIERQMAGLDLAQHGGGSLCTTGGRGLPDTRDG